MGFEINTIDDLIVLEENCQLLNLNAKTYFDDFEWEWGVYHKEIVLLKYKGKERELVLPPFVTGIGYNCFLNSDIQSIRLENVKYIGQRAFMNCSNLRNVEVLGQNRLTIFTGAFANCINLHSMDLSNVQEIGEQAFSNCYNLKNINNLNRLVKMSSTSFKNCRNLLYINKQYKSLIR